MQTTAKIIRLTFLGGAIGTLLRYLLTIFISNIPGVLLANLLGAFAIGWFNADDRFNTDERKAFWSIGVAGGFTTMSGLASIMVVLSFDTLYKLGMMAYAYGAVFFGVGLLFYWLGFIISRKLNDKRVADAV